MSIQYLRPEDVQFSKTEGGFLSLRIGRKKPIPRVSLYRIFPLSEPDRLISVRDEKDNEIGMIESLNEYPTETARLIEEDLGRRYFAPEIRKVNDLKEEFGYTYWDVETDSGFRRFTAKGGDNKVFHLDQDTLMIIDVDGNRFTYPNFEKTESKFLKIIDTQI